MPNWVYNNLSVIGPKDEVDRFLEQAGRPYEVRYRDYGSDEQVTRTHESVFSFWNFVRPEDDRLDDYFSTADGSAPADNWYAWNINHWGTKWDANDADAERLGDDHAVVRFSTAWSPPEPAILAASTQFPALTLTLEWEEEQGFGAETVYDNGTSEDVRSWDIPASHADHEERERDCICSYEDDTEYWYDDCPRPEPEVDGTAVAEILDTVSEMV